jgi:hypothetical protein
MWKKLTSRFESNEDPRDLLKAIVIPAAYFFVALILVCGYNDVIAALRFDGSADLALNRIDASLLGGITVASLAQGLSLHEIDFLKSVYTFLFSLIGGCLVLLALRYGRRTAMSYIGTIVTVYYIALVVFYFVPATGPYYPADTSHPYVQVLNELRDPRAPKALGTDYFIALPCLHIAQPLIALWFVRRWKVIASVLAAYCLAVIPTVFLLQEHYVVDVIGGVIVAIIAIAMVPTRIPEQ